MFHAASKGYTEIVQTLLKVPLLNIDKAAGYGTTPLFIAAHCGHVDVVRLLLNHPSMNKRMIIQRDIHGDNSITTAKIGEVKPLLLNHLK